MDNILLCSKQDASLVVIKGIKKKLSIDDNLFFVSFSLCKSTSASLTMK